jgi:hypothetical protein
MTERQRAVPGSAVSVVIAIRGDEKRTQVFSTPQSASAWIDRLDDEWACVCIEPMIVDVPEFGNEGATDA